MLIAIVTAFQGQFLLFITVSVMLMGFGKVWFQLLRFHGNTEIHNCTHAKSQSTAVIFNCEKESLLARNPEKYWDFRLKP